MRAAKFLFWLTLAVASGSAVGLPTSVRYLFPDFALRSSGAPDEGSREAAFQWEHARPSDRGMDAARLAVLQEELSRRGTKALLVIRGDAIVLEWYAPDHGRHKLHHTASLTKSLAGISLVLAMNDGLLRPDDPVHWRLPEWKDDPLRRRITIRHLATYSSGLEDASSPDRGVRLNDLRGWKGDFWRGRWLEERGLVHARRNPFTISLRETPIVFEPGTAYGYSNPGMAVLAVAVTAAIKDTRHEDVRTLLRERIMKPIGIGDSDWALGYGRTFVVDGLPVVKWGGGEFTARALARIGRLLLRKGDWDGTQLIESRWIEQTLEHDGTPLPVKDPDDRYPAPSILWYNNSQGVWKGVPRDAFAGAGAGNQHLLVVPSLDLLVVRYGSALDRRGGTEVSWAAAYDHLIAPVVAATTDGPTLERGPSR